MSTTLVPVESSPVQSLPSSVYVVYTPRNGIIVSDFPSETASIAKRLADDFKVIRFAPSRVVTARTPAQIEAANKIVAPDVRDLLNGRLDQVRFYGPGISVFTRFIIELSVGYLIPVVDATPVGSLVERYLKFATRVLELRTQALDPDPAA